MELRPVEVPGIACGVTYFSPAAFYLFLLLTFLSSIPFLCHTRRTYALRGHMRMISSLEHKAGA